MDLLVDAGSLDNASVRGQIACQYREAAVSGVGMLGVAYTAVLSIKVESVPALGLGECPRGTFTSRGGVKQLDRLRRGPCRVCPTV